MTGLPPEQPIPKSRLPWIIAGIALVALLVVGGLWWASANSGNDPDPSTSPTSEAPQPSTSPTPTETGVGPEPGVDDIAPTGCIAGNGNGIDMLLDARANSPQTASGAVEFAAAASRFFYRDPYPTRDELAQVAAFHADGEAIVDSFEDSPAIAPGIAPAGTPLQATMVGGAWYMHEFEGDSANVSIAFYYNVNGVREGDIVTARNFVLTWGEGGWVLSSDGQQRLEPNDVLELGTAFTGAC